MTLSIIIILGLSLGLFGFFFRRGQKQIADSLASNEKFNWLDFLNGNLLDISISIIILLCGIFRLDLGETIPSPPDTLTFVSAIVFGSGIPLTVSNFILPIFGLGDKSRKENRKIIDHKTNELDKLKK